MVLNKCVRKIIDIDGLICSEYIRTTHVCSKKIDGKPLVNEVHFVRVKEQYTQSKWHFFTV